MTTALPTARALGLAGAAPEPWITLNRSSSTYFEERTVQESGATAVLTIDSQRPFIRVDSGKVSHRYCK